MERLSSVGAGTCLLASPRLARIPSLSMMLVLGLMAGALGHKEAEEFISDLDKPSK